MPEDVYCLIKKAVNIRRHLEKCKKDKDAKYRLILVESKIHRLGRYYRRTKKLPNKWRYNAKTASTMVSAWLFNIISGYIYFIFLFMILIN